MMSSHPLHTKPFAHTPILLRTTELSKTHLIQSVADSRSTSSERTLPLWEGVTMTLRQGERVVLMGRSGSGKSTLLNCLYGLDTPTTGEVWVYPPDKGEEGVLLHTLSEEAQCFLRLQQYGYIFQMFHLLPTMTVLENVMLPLELLSGQPVLRVEAWRTAKGRHQAACDILHQVGLSHRVHHMPSMLSGGEMQRVAIARAMVHQPSLVFADEPTGNLDAHAAETVLSLLLSLSEASQLTLFMVTHSQEVAQTIATRRLCLQPASETGVCRLVEQPLR
ncbi:MAG: ABC transporter ATP-binding protein [Vampirovibrionales bacterium]